MGWKSVGIQMEDPQICTIKKLLSTNQTDTKMEAKEFTVFRALLADVHSKAFGEPISKLSYGKAQTLSWLIHEATGELLCYKTLSNYVSAALESKPNSVNPTDATLTILAQFVAGAEAQVGRQMMRMGSYAPWYKYRSSVLARPMAA